MADITLKLELEPRWFTPLAIRLGIVALMLGIIPPKPSAAHHGGIEPPADRLARWLVAYGYRLSVTRS